MDKLNKGEAPLKDTPPANVTPEKDFFDRILDATENASSNEDGVAKKKEEETPETPKAEAAKAEETPAEKQLRETLENLVKEDEKELDSMRSLLPNTKDEAKKLELERKIFETEKKIDKIKSQITPREVIVDSSEVSSLLDSMELPKDGEAYKIIDKMKGQRNGAADLLKMYGMIAKAIKADIDKVNAAKKAPITMEKPKDDGSGAVKEDNSIVGQISRSIKNQ